MNMHFYKPLHSAADALVLVAEAIKKNHGCTSAYKEGFLRALFALMNNETDNNAENKTAGEKESGISISLEWKEAYTSKKYLSLVEWSWEKTTFHTTGYWVTVSRDDVSVETDYGDLSSQQNESRRNLTDYSPDPEKTHYPTTIKGHNKHVSERTLEMIEAREITPLDGIIPLPEQMINDVTSRASIGLIPDKTLAKRYVSDWHAERASQGLYCIDKVRLTNYETEVSIDIKWIPVYVITYKGCKTYVDAVSLDITELSYKKNNNVVRYKKELEKPIKGLRALIPLLVLVCLFGLYLYAAGLSISLFGSCKKEVMEDVPMNYIILGIIHLISVGLFGFFIFLSANSLKTIGSESFFMDLINKDHHTPEEAFVIARKKCKKDALSSFFLFLGLAIAAPITCQLFLAIGPAVNLKEEFTFNNPLISWIASLFK